MQIQDSISTLSMSSYAHASELAGERVMVSRSGTYWKQGEIGSLTRIPLFEMSTPDPREVRCLLLDGRTAVVSYLIEPDENHPPNALLYVCRDPSYSVDKLASAARSNIRKAIKFLRFSWTDKRTLLDHGLPAYRDSKLRNGLSDHTPDLFRARLGQWFSNPGNHVLGAWKDDRLIAFSKVTAVDDWVEIMAYCANEGQEFRPNNGLIHCLLEHFLTDRQFQTITYGFSSVQEESKGAGLHRFKVKVGFQAIPVHRMFVLHPLLRPFSNRFSLAIGRGLLKISPGNRVLKKGCGVLARLVNVDTGISMTQTNDADG